jgi:hypothetical protein
MMQSPSQRGRIQLELKALIYQALENRSCIGEKAFGRNARQKERR